MAYLNAINCNKEQFALGTVDCEPLLGEFSGFITVDSAWKIPVADIISGSFGSEEVLALIQNGTFEPFLNSVEFTNNTPEATTKEYTGGIMKVIRNGKPQYRFEFDKGVGYHKAAYSRNSQTGKNVLLIDESGTLVGAYTGDGLNFTGFNMSMYNTNTYVPKTGDETPKTLIDIQLGNEAQFNTRMALLTVGQSGIDFNTDIYPIIGVSITGTASVASGFNVNVNAVNNTIYGIEALTADNFRIRNTVTNAVLAIDTVVAGATPGNYVIETTTPPTLAATYVVETYDATATPPVNVALVGTNQFYKGVSPILTTVA